MSLRRNQSESRMPEIGTSGLMSGVGKQGGARRQYLRPTSTLPLNRSLYSFHHTTIGRRMKKVAPWPGSLEKSMAPSCSCTMRKVMARPIPEPSLRVVK